MRVKVSELQEGCILQKDVTGMTVYPLVPKKTVLNPIHLDVLKRFSIDSVEVERTLVDGTLFKPQTTVEDTEDQKIEAIPLSFTESYLKAISEFKQEFTKWQSGGAVDFMKVRSIIMPLLKKVIESPENLHTIRHYSNPKDYLYHHSVAVGLISGMLAKKLGYDVGVYNQAALGGMLSDCGMARTRASILEKKSLSQWEFQEIREHTLNSYKMVKDSPLLKPEIKLAIYQHHERLDGTGYPGGEKADKIHMMSRIIAVADVYHAMTSERAYRSKQSPFKVLEMITEDSFGQFDISVVKALLSIIGDLSIGTKVRLSNGEEGSVIFTKREALTRPLVKLEKSEEIIDLVQNRNIFIEDVI
ncbi:HD-GYP domain-containing protein [Falsibacillus pallidus]|uniref:HD-GYP domain-containing protein n=1 Tax=Falsibacillus pallidus TaxID=493781 RepID=UPI003D95E621